MKRALRNALKDLRTNIGNEDTWSKGYQIVVGKLCLRRLYDMPDDITKAIIPKLFDVGRENSSCRTFEWKEPQITPFDTEELELVAKKMKSGEAPGLDGVPPEVIKEIGKTNSDWILGVMNDQLRKRSQK